MRHLYLLSSTLFLATTAAMAHAQWNETLYSQNTGNIQDTRTPVSNTTGNEVYSFGGYVNFTVTQKVIGDWWSVSGQPFSTDPQWRSGYETEEDLSTDMYTNEYGPCELPNGYRVKITLSKTIIEGDITWYCTSDPTAYAGAKHRKRTWETPGAPTMDVELIP